MSDPLIATFLSSLASLQSALRPDEPLDLLLAASPLLLVGAWGAGRGLRRLMTLRARALMPGLSRVLARFLGTAEYSLDALLGVDGAGPEWVARRRRGLDRLSSELRQRQARSAEWGERMRERFSDLRFTDANRVPFPFRRLARERFNLCSVVTQSSGPRVLDLDGQWTLDVSGSYGVNVAGYDRYKEWMRRGLERVADVGPVLGPLHPLVEENVEILRRISGQDEVSFHMSGTEAVMAAVRLARHNTRRKYVVCFQGAYHGWWDGVQPGIGSEREIRDCLTLQDLSPASLTAIRWRAREIACVLVNPVQAFHPNAPPPSDAVLLTSEARQTAGHGAGHDPGPADGAIERYAAWLRELRRVCTESGVPLIFDEVYSGFRLAPGGAQERFSVQADMVVYGKTVAGGMPIGVVCGRRDLMCRFDPERPMRIAYVIGTFSAHPVVMGAMREFLEWIGESQTRERYREADRRVAEWALETNEHLAKEELPIRVVHLGTIWTVLFKEPSRYSWLLQYYLRAEGLTLSWVGTGRCLSSMDFGATEYQALRERIVRAATRMREDGFWPSEADNPGRERKMRIRLVRELLASLVRAPRALDAFAREVMQRKVEDHHASHNNAVNQVLHLISSSVFLFCYLAVWTHVTWAMWLGLSALLVRQLGHAVFEPACHEEERKLLGFTTPSKTAIVVAYLLIPVGHLLAARGEASIDWALLASGVAWHWLIFTLAVVLGRVAYLALRHGLWSSSVWLVKLATDPLSDVFAYAPLRLRRG